MSRKLSHSRTPRSRGRTLLSIDKNYARRISTLYKKAFEAPGAIADEATRARCRLAVMQELDGVCTVFLTHSDQSWPPSRDDLKKFRVLNPEHFMTVNQANGNGAHGSEGDTSEDDFLPSLDLLSTTSGAGHSGTHLGVPGHGSTPVAQPEYHDVRPLMEAFTLPATRQEVAPVDSMNETSLDTAPVLTTPPKSIALPNRADGQNQRLSSIDLSVFGAPSGNIAPSVESKEPALRLTSIDPSILRTPPNRIATPDRSPEILLSSLSHRSSAARLAARREASVSPSPRRRKGIWRTQKDKTRAI